MNNTIEKQMFPDVIKPKFMEVLKPSEKKVVKRFAFTPQTVNVGGILHKTVWLKFVYDHYTKQPKRKVIYSDTCEEIDHITLEWKLDKTTLHYEETSN